MQPTSAAAALSPMRAVWPGFTSGMRSGTSASIRWAEVLEHHGVAGGGESLLHRRPHPRAAPRTPADSPAPAPGATPPARPPLPASARAGATGDVGVRPPRRAVRCGQRAECRTRDVRPGAGTNRWPTTPVAPNTPTGILRMGHLHRQLRCRSRTASASWFSGMQMDTLQPSFLSHRQDRRPAAPQRPERPRRQGGAVGAGRSHDRQVATSPRTPITQGPAAVPLNVRSSTPGRASGRDRGPPGSADVPKMTAKTHGHVHAGLTEKLQARAASWRVHESSGVPTAIWPAPRWR